MLLRTIICLTAYGIFVCLPYFGRPAALIIDSLPSVEKKMSAPHNPNAGQAPLEPDPSPDQDSTCGDSIDGLSMVSLTPSIYHYREIHGRTYHCFKDRQYEFPNDAQEMDRLDLQHHMYGLLLSGELFLAPIKTPQNVLDIGTGTGIWAIDFADMHPSASVIGTDLSPIQPKAIPPNLQFLVEDSSETWMLPRIFDFIHCRQLHMALDEKRLFQQSLKALIPGGWLEIKEVALPLACDDGTLQGTSLSEWTAEITKAAEMIGTPLDKPWSYRKWMEEAGFINVKQVIHFLPTNMWPKDEKLKELGTWQMVNVLEGLEGFSLALFTKTLGWSREELEILLAAVRKDVQNRKIHAYWKVVTVIGQKPLTFD